MISLPARTSVLRFPRAAQAVRRADGPLLVMTSVIRRLIIFYTHCRHTFFSEYFRYTEKNI